jgi:hypothetical protein
MPWCFPTNRQPSTNYQRGRERKRRSRGRSYNRETIHIKEQGDNMSTEKPPNIAMKEKKCVNERGVKTISHWL